MTVAPIRRITLAPPDAGRPPEPLGWRRRHRTSMLIVVPLLALVGVVTGVNMGAYPGLINDDEGTYLAQAWAVTEGSLAHYTYWYDHPPLGWIQIALYMWVTNGFGRGRFAVVTGRELMLIATLVSSAMMYLVMRRLQFGRLFACLAVLLFALSPLAVFYHRMVFLDNLEVMWMLVAMVFAVSPRRSLGSACGCAVAMGVATLSKETAGILVPVVVWLLWQNHPRKSRTWALGVFFTMYISCGLFYVLYATLKGELLPGAGHVDLISALRWQLLDRASSGSVLDETSPAHNLVSSWLNTDRWLLAAALVLTPLAVVARRLRPITLGYLLQVALLFRSGYLPQAYVVAALPFAAMSAAGAIGHAWAARPFRIVGGTDRWLWVKRVVNRGGLLVAVAAVVVFAASGLPRWRQDLDETSTRNAVINYSATLDWIIAHVPKSARLVVDDNMWMDLRLRGYTNIDWLYKVDLDPAIKATYPAGYRDIDYVILLPLPEPALRTLPTVWDAMNNADVVQRFGDPNLDHSLQYTVYRVRSGAS